MSHSDTLVSLFCNKGRVAMHKLGESAIATCGGCQGRFTGYCIVKCEALHTSNHETYVLEGPGDGCNKSYSAALGHFPAPQVVEPSKFINKAIKKV